MAEEDTEGSGRTHQGSDSPFLQQHELYIFVSEPGVHTRTKQIEVHYHFIRERVLVGDVDLQHISTNLQTADIFTQALGANKLWQFMTEPWVDDP